MDAETAAVTDTSEKEEELSAVSIFLDKVFGKVNGVLAKVLFFSVTGDAIKIGKVDRDGNPVFDESTGEQLQETVHVQFIVLVLVLGAVFFTFWYRWINIRGFKHSIDVIRGKSPVWLNADLGAAIMVAIKLGVESYRQGKVMLFDEKTGKVTTG